MTQTTESVLTKRCINCGNLQSSHFNGSGTPRFECDQYQENEDDEVARFDMMSTENAENAEGCLNWIEKTKYESETFKTTEYDPEPETENADENDELETLRHENEFYRERQCQIASLRIDLLKAEDEAAAYKEEAKGIRKRLDILMSEIAHGPETYPLFEAAEKNRQDAPAPVANMDYDDWMTIPAKDVLNLTENEFSKLATDLGVDVMTLKDIEEIRSQVQNGKKIKGVGPALIQKLDDQMLEFWSKRNEGRTVLDASELRDFIEDREGFYSGMHYEDFCARLEEMLFDGKFEFAYDTLEGMQKWASENDHVTPRMIMAANNIYNAGDNYEPIDWEEE